MIIRNSWLDIDVLDCLRRLGIKNVRETSTDNIGCSCPVIENHGGHQDTHPSFSIHRETGLCHCFACGWAGTLERLVAYCLGLATELDAYLWLCQQYGAVPVEEREPIEVENLLTRDSGPEVLDEAILTEYRWRHPYLAGRGIREETQRAFEIGYDRDAAAVTFPWRDRLGRLRMVKRRPVLPSSRRYDNQAGVRKRDLLYGIWKVQQHGLSEVYVAEGEIDCLTLWQAGKPAVALGGCILNDEQVVELMRAGVRTVVLMLDNDDAGRNGEHEALSVIAGRMKCLHAVYPRTSAKDPNDLTEPELNAVKTREPM